MKNGQESVLSITPAQFARLGEISAEAKIAWKSIQELEKEAYGITQETDKEGHTTDLIYWTEATNEHLIKMLKIEVKE